MRNDLASAAGGRRPACFRPDESDWERNVVDKKKAVAVKATPAAKTKDKDSGFKKGDFVVYPTHGGGKVLGVENQEISGHTLQVIIISFDRQAIFKS